MLFALGFIAGIALSVFVAVVLVLLQKPIIQTFNPVVKAIEIAGPRPRGFVVQPRSDADEVREERIRQNAEQGKDTPISELL